MIGWKWALISYLVFWGDPALISAHKFVVTEKFSQVLFSFATLFLRFAKRYLWVRKDGWANSWKTGRSGRLFCKKKATSVFFWEYNGVDGIYALSKMLIDVETGALLVVPGLHIMYKPALPCLDDQQTIFRRPWSVFTIQAHFMETGKVVLWGRSCMKSSWVQWLVLIWKENGRKENVKGHRTIGFGNCS